MERDQVPNPCEMCNIIEHRALLDSEERLRKTIFNGLPLLLD
jgi:hypothetical protein